MIVDRRASRLNDEYVRTAHRLADSHAHLAIAEPVDCGVTQIDPQSVGDLVGQRVVCISAQQLQFPSNHWACPSL